MRITVLLHAVALAWQQMAAGVRRGGDESEKRMLPVVAGYLVESGALVARSPAR